MMDEEREVAEEVLHEASEQTKVSKEALSPQKSTVVPRSSQEISEAAASVNDLELFAGSRLVRGKLKDGDTATAAILANAIDEAVGTGKLGQDKLTVAELQLLDDISRGSAVSIIFLRF